MVDVHLIQHGETMMISMNFSGSSNMSRFFCLFIVMFFFVIFLRFLHCRSRHCFDELSWPWKLSHPFFMKPVKPGKV
jgi:hypothetical protein